MRGNEYSLMKRVVFAAALAAGVSGIANAADYSDNSMSRLGGDWYAYSTNPAIDKSPSARRQSHPNGLSNREMQSMWGTWAGQFRLNKPVFPSTASDAAFKQTHPQGLTDREPQILSPEAPAFQLPKGLAATATASDSQTDVARSPHRRTFVARLANFSTRQSSTNKRAPLAAIPLPVDEQQPAAV